MSGVPFPITTTFDPACPNCRKTMQTNVDLAYFAGALPVCKNCGQPFDWLDVFTNLFIEGDVFYQALGPAGAQWTLTRITLRPRENLHLDLAEHGVPADARVLFVNYSPTLPGGLFPIEWHGNTPQPQRHGKRILLPIEFGQPPYGPTEVTVLAAWVPSRVEHEPWAEFLRALEAHVAGDYDAAIVPASAAVETAAWRLVHVFVDPYTSKRNLKGFESEASFSDLLNVLIPAFAAVRGLPIMSDVLRGRVNRLRELRNDIAHRGRPERPITKRESSEVLAAGLLTHRYCDVVAARAVDLGGPATPASDAIA